MFKTMLKLDRNELCKAVRTALSLGAVASVGAVGSAYAQDQAASQGQSNQQPQTLQTIVVTGSHIRRVDLETSNPVVTIGRAQIQQSGKLTLGDILQELPAAMGPSQNPATNNGGGSGTSTVGLRGLGADRTLVLVDGQRVDPSIGLGFSPTIGVAFPDINAIPASMIERVEVLTTGASAVYGSDAIGGVVNFITRKNYQGAEFTADYGISDRDDGVRKGYSFTFGQSSDKGSIIGGVDYNKQAPIFEGNRQDFGPLSPALSLSATSTANGKLVPAVFAGGSATGVYGNIAVPSSLQSFYNCPNNGKIARNHDSDGATLADYHCAGSADKYNYAAVNYAMTPQERTNAFVSGTYHLTDNIDAYLTAYHDKTAAAFDLAPEPALTTQGLVVSATNPFNPFGVDFSNASGNTFGFRALPAGLRGAANGKNVDQVNTGLRGNFQLGQQSWTWDLGFNYGHGDFQSITLGLLNLGMLNPHFGPAVAGGCGSAAAPVSCANPFNIDDPTTVAALQSSEFNPVSVGYNQERVKHLDLSGGIVDLPAGTMSLAVGASYRSEYLHTFLSPERQGIPPFYSCLAGSQCNGSTQGGFSVKEAYAELFVPVLKDLPLARALNVTLGDRFSKYSNVGSTSNPKIGVEWKPIDDLLLRGTVAKVFRAPTTGEIFGAPVSSATKLASDPCDHFTGAPAGSGPALACAGVPTDGSFVNSDVAENLQTTVIASGANFAGLPIKPEAGKSFDFGFVYDPHFIPGLSVSADLWRIYLNNVLTLAQLQNELAGCFAGDPFSVQYFCPLIKRFTNGGSQGNIAPNAVIATTNLGRVDTRGVDANLRYKLPQFSFGQFSLGLDATYLTQYDAQTAPGTAANFTYHEAGHLVPFGSPGEGVCPLPNGAICLFPRVRANAFVNWQSGAWDASWRTRYISKFDMGSPDLSEQVNPGGPLLPGLVLHYGSTVYNDFTVGYTIQPINTKIEFGVDNVFDKAPPLLYANNVLNANTDPSDFDLVGRFYHARVTVKF